MKKIIHIPLDERPCNYDFPHDIFTGKEFDVVRVPFEFMGLKKRPGNIDKISEFLLNDGKDATAAIISIDTLVYGGIVPSRLHYFTIDEAISRLEVLKELKKINPEIKLYCYNLVMRCPHYDDDDEEPFYYQTHGLRIHEQKAIEHKIKANVATEEEIKYYKSIDIPEEYISDYQKRREVNVNVTCKVVDLVAEGIIDFLIVPQDDSAPYGYTALDQMRVRSEVDKYNLQFKVLTYPGADEVSNTLFARMLNEYYNKKPLVFVKYPSEECKMVIPCAEDRPLDISVRSQIIASGCLMTPDIKEADLILAINSPSQNMISSGYREYSDYFGYVVGRNLVDFVEFIEYCIDVYKKPVTICDIGYCNGSDPALIRLMNNKKLFMKVAGYASWNIPCNSLGTALPMGIRYIYPHNEKLFDDFLMHRYIEDFGYSCVGRDWLRKNYCNEQTGYTIYDTKGQRDPQFIEMTTKIMNEAIAKDASFLFNKYVIKDMWFPWSRTYDIGLDIEYIGEHNG